MNSIEKLQEAMTFAMEHRPPVGGFPFLAACLHRAGVKRNVWYLPALESVYIMEDGTCVVHQGTPLVTGMVEVPSFDKEALVVALRTDQTGGSTFPEFLSAAWSAGVMSYEVDFETRTVTYTGARGEEYVESYPLIEL